MAENDEILRPIEIVDIDGYSGPDRRKNKLYVGPCDCHKKHSRILTHHDDEIRELRDDMKNHVETADTKIASKMSTKLFLGIMGLFTAVFVTSMIGGIVALDGRVDDFTVNMATVMGEQNTKVAEQIGLLNTNAAVLKMGLDNHMKASERIEEELRDIRRKVEDHVEQTNNGNHHGG